MNVIHLSYPLQQRFETRQVLAIGDFDGVHLGHCKVIGDAVQIANAKGCSSAVMTFNPHPREVLGHVKYEHLLTPYPHKLRLLSRLNVDTLYVFSFTEQFANVSADEFISEVLEKMNLQVVVIGFDFTFGNKGRGNAAYLREQAAHSFDVKVVEPHLFGTEKVSSTRIRSLLEKGDVADIPPLLGRYYDMTGRVEYGDGRGRSIGFPTANLQLDGSYIFPKLGVYAVRATVDDEQWNAVVNIGKRPTFLPDSSTANVEAHLLDFDGELYGKTMTIELIQFIRSEIKFSGVDALVEQIRYDIVQAIDIFQGLQH